MKGDISNIVIGDNDNKISLWCEEINNNALYIIGCDPANDTPSYGGLFNFQIINKGVKYTEWYYKLLNILSFKKFFNVIYDKHLKYIK